MKKQASGKSVLQVPSMREVAEQICSSLGEWSDEVQGRIGQVVRDYGLVLSLQFATEAILLVRERGPVAPDADHQHTPREIFFELIETRGQRQVRDPHPLSPEEIQVRKTAFEISRALGETRREPRLQIERVLRVLGEQKTRELLQQTQEIEQQGGMMRENGQRRTPGGTFFQLVRQNVAENERYRVFWEPINAARKHRQQLSAAHRAFLEAQKPKKQIVPPALVWRERYIWPEADQRGEVAMKLVLTGRPTKVVIKDAYVIIGMRQKRQIPPLPKELPIPSEEYSPIDFDVFILSKHWEPVAPTLQEDESDILLIDTLWQTLDKERGVIVVYAASITTKRLQEAKRQRPLPARGRKGTQQNKPSSSP
jgi:hypothetical protein